MHEPQEIEGYNSGSKGHGRNAWNETFYSGNKA